jgi:hypothetical protein
MMCRVYTANEGSARAALALMRQEGPPSLHFTSTSSLERRHFAYLAWLGVRE